ncbi:MAG: transporter substrate-binding domain-containing protein [Prevotella sp.]|nr:transporter substrate-binding domain-containing protein [Prevotella sp.]
MMKRNLYILCIVLCLPFVTSSADSLSDKYNKKRPLVIAGDWDKPPYEFLNDRGLPDGSNIELMKTLCDELDIPCRFILKEWSSALKAFQRGDADIILANGRRYQGAQYAISENIINYNRICAAMVDDTVGIISIKSMLDNGVAMKPSDYTCFFFRNLDSLRAAKVEYQSPKVALQGIIAGDYKYFLWGEEPLKWKIKELNLENISLADVNIPVSEIHIIGRDSDLIYELDDLYSRLKQSGEVQRINDSWFHPELVKNSSRPYFLLFIILGVVALAAVVYLFNRVAKAHVRSATRNSTDLNNMMLKALHMGNFHVMDYDIRNDRWSNRYGQPILPDEGLTLKEFTERIHPNEQEEFSRKMSDLLNGRERKFELKKRWKLGEIWLNLDGHAMVELDDDGRPAYVINAVDDVTQNVQEDRAAHDLVCKYNKLSNMPFVAMSFYDKDGWLIGLNDSMREVCGITPDNPESSRYWLTVCMFDIPLFRSAYSPADRHELLACMHMDYPEMGIDRYVEYHIMPLFNAEGELANYFCSTLDITDEYARYQAMHDQEHKIQQTMQRIDRYDRWLKFLTKQGNTYLWYSDVSKQTAYYFQSLKAANKTDFIVMPFEVHTGYMHPDGQKEALAYYNSPKPFESVQHFTNTVLNTGPAWYRINGTPIFDKKGSFVGHRGLSIEITPEMAAKERLEEETRLAEDIGRQKSGFMASMTHELRTPLNAIIGFSGVLPVTDDVHERDEYIRIIRSNCDMLQRLINDILTASSLSESPTNIKPVEVDFALAFEDICLTLRQRLQNSAVEFTRENPYFNFVANLDVERIQQVLTNFVTNAVKFTKEGHIRLGYRYFQGTPGILYFYCEDTGIGIPKEKQGIVFDRFVKLDEFVQGTGMGLAICKSIVERMDGEIGIESDGIPGHGTTFWFRIPCNRKNK